MGYVERNTWSQLIASAAGTAVYLVLVLPQLGTTPIGEIAWQWPMVWTIAGAIVVSIVISILWGIGAGMRDPDEEHDDTEGAAGTDEPARGDGPGAGVHEGVLHGERPPPGGALAWRGHPEGRPHGQQARAEEEPGDHTHGSPLTGPAGAWRAGRSRRARSVRGAAGSPHLG